MANVDWDPDAYLDSMLAEIPRYLELQERVAAATESLDIRAVLELGTGTGETARRVLALHPNARWTGVDANAAMLDRARETLPGAVLRQSRLEDPLPPGPFDLVVAVLSIHHRRCGQGGSLSPHPRRPAAGRLVPPRRCRRPR